MNYPRVGIVVLNYNGAECLPACLRGLQGLVYPNISIVVVDNGSSDASLALARAAYPECQYIPLEKNLGFAAGMNRGMEVALRAGAEYVWLMNNDAIPQEDALARLVTVAEKDPRLGLLSPLILTPEKNLWFGKARLSFWRMRAVHALPTPRERGWEWYESPLLTGCALFLKKATIETVGFLDERFFLYYEDADYSLRARAQGLVLGVVPAARVFHWEQSQVHPEKLYHLVLSGLIFFRKHAPWFWRPYLILYLALRRLKNAVDCLRHRPYARTVARAYATYFSR